ncbi:MAG: nucleotidyltransferase domain-containing protein [Bacteroidia bacterium]|nr:nucleotidyltransferase domain-containing protein [Bacteroidia bacterium]
MDARIDKILKEYIEVLLKKQISIEKAYLFGSYANNTWNADSDIDIAIIYKFPIKIDRFDFQVQLLTMASDIDTRIEPHPILLSDFNINNPFAYEIMKTGIEIKIK